MDYSIEFRMIVKLSRIEASVEYPSRNMNTEHEISFILCFVYILYPSTKDEVWKMYKCQKLLNYFHFLLVAVGYH